MTGDAIGTFGTRHLHNKATTTRAVTRIDAGTTGVLADT
jgi:hypothetical protein